MKEFKCTKIYLGHLIFYYDPNSFIIPISAIIDREGIIICFGYWGLNWIWKKDSDAVVTI